MELDGSSKVGGLWCLGGGSGGGGGGGGRMHCMTEWAGRLSIGGAGAAITTGARNSFPGGAGSSNRLIEGNISVS